MRSVRNSFRNHTILPLPILQVTNPSDRIVITLFTIATWEHLDNTYALDWSNHNPKSVYRQVRRPPLPTKEVYQKGPDNTRERERERERERRRRTKESSLVGQHVFVAFLSEIWATLAAQIRMLCCTELLLPHHGVPVRLPSPAPGPGQQAYRVLPPGSILIAFFVQHICSLYPLIFASFSCIPRIASRCCLTFTDYWDRLRLSATR